MNIKKTTRLCAAGFAITAGADTFKPVYSITEQNWTNSTLWISTNRPGETVFPGDEDETRICSGIIRITTRVTVGYLKVGAEGSGKVIIDGGSLVTVGSSDYNSASYKVPGALIVINGGSAVFNSRFMVGFQNSGGGRVEIYDGSIRINQTYYHNMEYNGQDKINTRTTIHAKGILDVNGLILNSGIMDVSGGTVIIRTGYAEQINQWVADGRIVAMGGAEGWKIKVTVNPSTGYITLVAEPSGETFSVGMICPVPPVSARGAF
jgi:hypothetical protein